MPEAEGPRTRILRLLSILCAAGYLVSQAWQPYPANWLLKGMCAGTLAAIAFSNRLPILGTALAFSTTGDVLLDLDPDRFFICGLTLFLLAHLTYIFLFAQNRPRPLLISRAQATIVILVCLHCGAISAWLLPGLDGLAIPVVAYMLVITAMVVTSILTQFPSLGIVSGTLLFLASDTLLAINKFKTAVPLRDYLVWATYYLAQYLIATGFLRQRRQNSRA